MMRLILKDATYVAALAALNLTAEKMDPGSLLHARIIEAREDLRQALKHFVTNDALDSRKLDLHHQ